MKASVCSFRILVLALFAGMPLTGRSEWQDPSTWEIPPEGRGIGVLQYAPDGRLGVLLRSKTGGVSLYAYEGEEISILYRERQPGHAWRSPSLIIPDPDAFGRWFLPGVFDHWVLTYNQASEPVIFAFSSIASHNLVTRDSEGEWQYSSAHTPVGVSATSIAGMDVETDSEGTPHFIFKGHDTSGVSPRSLVYATYNNGSLSHDVILDDIGETLPTWGTVRHDYWDAMHVQRDPRNVSLAVAPNGAIHVVYGVQTHFQPISGGTEIRSELRYVTNESGSWSTPLTILTPGSGWGDAGMGASIAAAPDGTVAVAANFQPRARTGSPGVSRLVYLRRTPGGVWSSATLSDRSDNYIEDDGERGTGYHPMIKISDRGRVHVVFTDHASDHAPGHGALSYSGQVRYATRPSATHGSWTINTLVSRGNVPAWKFMNASPSIALGRTEFAIMESTYRWQVGPDGQYELNRWIRNPLFLHTTPLPPDRAPVGLSPTGDLGDERPEQLCWEPVVGATRYRVFVQRNGLKYLDEWVDSQSCLAVTGALPGGDYRWWVAGWSPGGLGPWSTAASFSVALARPEEAPTTAGPVGQIEDRRPVISWSSVEKATWYRVIVQRNGQSVWDRWIREETSIAVDMDLTAGDYTWWVAGWGPDGFGPWSAGTDFTLPLRVPGAITQLAPAGEVDDTAITYTWEHDANATWYRLWVGAAGGGTWHNQWFPPEGAGEMHAVPSIRPQPISVPLPTAPQGMATNQPAFSWAGGRYTWWVRAWSPDGFGPWSGPAHFTRPHPAGTWYRVYVSRGGTPVVDEWTQGASLESPVQLSPGAYAWWLGVWDPAAGRTLWTGRTDFQVE